MSETPPSKGWLHGLTDSLVRWRRWLLWTVALLTLLGLVPASRLRFDQSIESFYAADNPHLQAYLESKSLFGGDQFVIVAFEVPQLFTPEGALSKDSAARIREFAARLSRVPGVEPQSTQNLADALAIERFPLLKKQRQGLRKLFQGILLGDDDQTTAIVLRLQAESESPVSRSQTIAEIRRVAVTTNPATHVLGKPVQVNDIFRYIEQDGVVLGWVSMGLLVLVILVIFRRLRWVVLPVLVVEVTIVWTKALLVLGHVQLTMVSSMLNSLLMVIGIATVMHVTVRFHEHRVRLAPVAAVRATLRDLAHAIFWTTATTAAGFAAQLTSHVAPVQNCGLMIGLGSMLVLVSAATILPGGMLLGRQEQVLPTAPGGSRIGRLLALLNDWVEHHPRRLAVASVVIVLFSLGGMFRLRMETDFSKNFRATAPIVHATDFFETRFGGVGAWEVNFPVPEKLDDKFLDRVRSLATRLRELHVEGRPQLTKVVSLADGVDLVPLLPLSAKRALLRKAQPEFERGLHNVERGRMRIVLRARERQPSDVKLRLIGDVQRLAREEFPEAETTGLFVLLTFLIESLMDDQWISFALGGAMIITLMTIAFRSLRVGLISLVPNLLPIVFVIGTMGWLGLPINIATAMISSVSMGLTIDSSIHYFTGYRRARRQGQDVSAALRETNQGVGSALIYANLALIAGFLVLTLSHFVPLIYFGLLVSVAMLGGLIGNLILLPLLMRVARVE